MTTALDFSAYGPHRYEVVNANVTVVRIIRRTTAGEVLSGFWAEFVLVEGEDGRRHHVRRSSLHSDYDLASKEADRQSVALAECLDFSGDY